ncbi:MAG: V-type ATP synthase subunit F [Candidatus Heimdallarchaeota archaeon]
MADRLIFVFPPNHAIGYELAGAEVYQENNPQEAAKLITQLASDPNVGLIAIPDHFYKALDVSFLKRLETKMKPVIIRVPLVRHLVEPIDAALYVREAIKRAIGYYLKVSME